MWFNLLNISKITGEAMVDGKELSSLMSMLLNSSQTFCSNSEPKLSNVGESIAVSKEPMSRPRAYIDNKDVNSGDNEYHFFMSRPRAYIDSHG